jgi:4-hydroxy-2-oxoheptanedioate aldolase
VSELKARMRAGQPVFGTFVQIGDPAMLEIFGRAGADFAIIDFEHGGSSLDSVGQLVRAADVVGLPLLARLGPEELSRASQLLDTGVRGLLVPRVSSVQQAAAATSAAHYHPLGDRGACPGIRSGDYGWLGWDEHESRAARRTIVGIGIEGATGLAAAAEISRLPGIDFLFVGVFDLAHSLGHPGEVEHREVIEALRDIVAIARISGVAVGTWAPDLKVAARWQDLGVTVVTVATDALLWREACTRLITRWQAGDA